MFLPTLEEVDLKPLEDELIDTPADESVEPEDLVDGSLDEDLCCEEEDDDEAISDLPETVILPLPSNIISVNLGPSLESLRSIERELWKGQANDALEGLRIGLAKKLLLLLANVNDSTSTKQSTQAWASVWNAQTSISVRAWRALKCIGTPEDLVVHQKLEKKNLVVIKDITKAKQFRQGSESLA